MTKLIDTADVKGTGCIYYVEGFTYEGEQLYEEAFVWGNVLTAEQAIKKALERKPLTFVIGEIDEWRIQAIDIDTSAGVIIDNSEETLCG